LKAKMVRGFCKFDFSFSKRRGASIFAVIISFILFINFGYSFCVPEEGVPEAKVESQSTISTSSDYGVYGDLSNIIAEKETRYDSPEIVSETESVLSSVVPIEYQREYLLEPKIEDIVYPDLSYPYVFERAETCSTTNKSTIIEFLMEQPLHYWIFTRHFNDNGSTHESWTKGFLRPTLEFELNPPRLVDWDRFEKIDVDGNDTTGDLEGYDIEVRLTPVIPKINLIPPEFDLQNLTWKRWQMLIEGGAAIEMNRLGDLGNTLSNTEVYILKYFSYDNIDYIWIVGYGLEKVPSKFALRVLSENIRLTSDAPITSVIEFFQKLVNGTLLDNMTQIVSMEGPYKIQWDANESIPEIDALAGYAKLKFTDVIDPELGRIKITNFTERTYFSIRMLPSSGKDIIPSHFEAKVNSANNAFNVLNLSGECKSKISAKYYEEKENITFATFSIEDLPTYLNMSLDNNTEEGLEVSRLHFCANEKIAFFNYSEYQFLDVNTTPHKYYKHTSVLLRNIPCEFYLNGTFSARPEEEPHLVNEPGISLISRLIDSVMIRVSSRFAIIGKTLRAIPENVMNLGLDKGWFTLDISHDDSFGCLEFWITSGARISMTGNFVGFLNNSEPAMIDKKYELYPLSVSGRLSNIKKVNTRIKESSHIELWFENSEEKHPLKIFIHDPSNSANASIILRNVPGHLLLEMDGGKVWFGSDIGIENLVYVSAHNKQYISLDISGIPNELEIVQNENEISITTLPNEYINKVKFTICEGKLYNLQDDYVLLCRNETTNLVGGSISNLSNIRYIYSLPSSFTINSKGGQAVNLVLIDNRTYTNAKIRLYPMPDSVTFELPNTINMTRLQFMEIRNLTSVSRFMSIVPMISRLGDAVITALSEATEKIISQLSSVSRDIKLSYTSTREMTLIANISAGKDALMKKHGVKWTHGLMADIWNDDSLGYGGVNLKLYLPNLPKKGNLNARAFNDTTQLMLTLENFHPKYNWILIDAEGLLNRNIEIYFNELPNELSIKVNASITTNWTLGKAFVDGYVKWECWNSSDKPSEKLLKLGEGFVAVTNAMPLLTKMNFYLPTVPASLDIKVYLSDSVKISYRSNISIKYILLKLARLVKGNWYDLYGIIHDIPTSVDIIVLPDKNFDVDSSSPLQGLPSLTINTNSRELDLYIYYDGHFNGQRGIYELHLKDIPDNTRVFYDNGTYKLRSDRLGLLLLKVRDMPVNKAFQIKGVEIFAEDISSFDLKMNMVFGVYPVLEISECYGGTMKLSIDSDIDINGKKPTEAVLVDMAFTKVSGSYMPSGTSIYVNGWQSNLGDGSYHLVIPAPIATLVATLT